MSARIQRILDDLADAIRVETASLPERVGDLGDEIRRARKAERMSLDAVAVASGMTKSHVWEIEQGRSRNPTVGAVAGLSKALGVPFLRLAQAALNSRNNVVTETDR